ncbi:MAG: flagellar hook assembly protein FlgD [Rhodobacteraceae bacterium]|nr:flagellar hook assembly protein FlgD [Paracoccaceae bacterium]
MDAVTSATTTTAAATTSTAAITSDFNTFLTLMTTQLKNQDPLDPVDSSEFALQLATFSGVEQQVLTNDLLTAVSAQLAVSGLSQMSSWVGMEVRAPSGVYFDGEPVTIAPNPVSLADTVELVVYDSSGEEVQRFEIPVSAEPIEWAGVAPDGTPFPSGTYTFDVISYAGGEVLLSERADVYAKVTEVRSEGGEILLILEGGGAVSANAVSGMRNPNS